MLSQAQLLDELMGRDRNLAPQEKKSSLHWSDPSVCKMYVAGFCPHDLFTNTRSDLGFCEKLHDDKLRDEYKSSRRFGTMGYEDEFLRYLQSLLSDVDRRIRRGHSRLTTTQELMKEKQLGKLNTESEREKEAQLSEKVDSLVEQAEKLGCDGKVEEAQGVMKLVDQLKEERDMLTSKVKDPSFNGQEKLMEVCEVCGAFLIIGDAQIRVDDHLQGKQHKGYAQIKASVEEMKNRPWLNRSTSKDCGENEKKGVDDKEKSSEDKDKRSEDKDKRSEDKDKRSEDKDRRSEDKDRRPDSDRDRRRDRDGDRRDRDGDRRDRDGDRRDRDGDRRDRDGDRRDRDDDRRSRDRRDRDRDRRDRDRDRHRDRDRRRDRSRSRDRDRKRSSRDGERSRSREKEDSRGQDDERRREKDDSRRRDDEDRRESGEKKSKDEKNEGIEIEGQEASSSKDEKIVEEGSRWKKVEGTATEEKGIPKGSQDETSVPEKNDEEML